jgi:hypothetical protein
VIALNQRFIDPATLQITFDSTLTLHESDYTFDTLLSLVRLAPSTMQLLFPVGATSGMQHIVSVRFFALPIHFPQSFTRHQLLPSDLPDSLAGLLDDSSRHEQRLRRLRPTAETETHDPFLNSFQKSGSISRGFQLGTSRDLSLTSGFNLQFSGNLAKDVVVSGALTEENTPIQPEGNTQTLRDIDKVFITAKVGEHLSATFGDFYLNMNTPAAFGFGSQASSSTNGASNTAIANPLMRSLDDVVFTNVSRKLLGVQASAAFPSLEVPTTSIMFSGALARGKYSTNTFQGEEAFQGPYRLTGKNGERVIVIIAGTERVYVDGVLQTRGERNDYVIDYGLGEIIFQPRRLITSASRISVDFQYSDQQYTRTFLGGQAKSAFLDGAIGVTASFLREGDNPDAPLDLTLSDSDRTLLSQAGSDPFKAAKSGVIVVPRDSLGRVRGSYDRIDTVVGGTQTIIYVYSPFDTINAVYNINFGNTGTARGAYARIGVGQYQFVGAGNGDYDTLTFLPLPQVTQMLGFLASVRPFHSLGLSGEISGSQFTPNRFASDQINDVAYNMRGAFGDTVRSLSSTSGYLELTASDRRVGKNFISIDRTQDVDYLRRYGVDLAAGTGQVLPTSSSEETRESHLHYEPTNLLRIDGDYGTFDRREAAYSSERLAGHAELLEDSSFAPHINATLERLPTRDSSQHEQSVWLRSNALVSKSISFGSQVLTLSTQYATESRNTTPFFLSGEALDSLTSHSFSYRELTPGVALRLSDRFSIGSSYDIREDDSARSGALFKVSDAHTLRVNSSLTNIGGFSALFDLTVRKKTYSDTVSFREAGGNQDALLFRFEPRYALPNRALSIDALYEISNQRSARQERVFLPVRAGLGSYRYVEDFNHNGKQDPDEFALARYADEGTYILINVPTEQLFPTTDLRSSARLHFDLQGLLGQSTRDSSGLAKILGFFSGESFIRVEESSTDATSEDIYFYRVSHFQNDSTTIHGTIELEEDLNVLENNPIQSYRLRFLERRGANQFNTGLERTYTAERSIRGRFRPLLELTNETTIGSTTDIAVTQLGSYNRPHHTSSYNLVTDLSYHPLESPIDYGIRAELTLGNEESVTPNIKALTDAITLRSSYALESKARLRAELERDELTLTNSPSDVLLLPYSLTNGRSEGVTWLWRLALDYQFGAGIVATIAYDGRNEASDLLGVPGERRTIHNARAEVKASF